MSYPNTFHNDKWRFTFSNLPGVADMGEMRYYNGYIKNLSLPDYSMGEIGSIGPYGFKIRTPIAGMKKNTDLSNLQIEFKLSEDMRNYLYFFKWMKDLRYGNLDNGKYDGLFRKYTIKSGILSILDNQKRTVVNIMFTQMFLLDLSSIQLTMGSSDEVTFVCNFSYEEIEYKTKDPTIGGSNPTTPSLILPCSATNILPTSASTDWEI